MRVKHEGKSKSVKQPRALAETSGAIATGEHLWLSNVRNFANRNLLSTSSRCKANRSGR